MTERIKSLLDRTFAKEQKKFRRDHDWKPLLDMFIAAKANDSARARMGLVAMLKAEQPAFMEGETIAFLRTVKQIPDLHSDEEMAAFRAAGTAFGEKGVVFNLTADFGPTIRDGLLARISEMEAGDAEGVTFLSDAILSATAVLELADRYRAAAAEQGFTKVAETLAQVPARGARTFHEALQSLRILHYAILHYAMWCEGEYHCGLGRIDQYLYPYLEADLAAGRLTEETALEELEEFFIACNRDSDLYIGVQQGDNGQSVMLGGVTRDGKPAFNLLSRLALKACGELKLVDPKINLRVDKSTPMEIYELGTELTKAGLGFPQYANDDVVIPALQKWGYELEDARDYSVAACWEFLIPGCGMDINNIDAVSLPSCLDTVMRGEGRAPARPETFDALKESLRAEINRRCDALQEKYKHVEIFPGPFVSVISTGCIERARDLSKGGKYNNFGIHGTGIAVAVDSLAAVRELVFEKKLVTIRHPRRRAPRAEDGQRGRRGGRHRRVARRHVGGRAQGTPQRPRRHLPSGNRQRDVLHLARERAARVGGRPPEGPSVQRELRAVARRAREGSAQRDPFLHRARPRAGLQRRTAHDRGARQRLPRAGRRGEGGAAREVLRGPRRTPAADQLHQPRDARGRAGASRAPRAPHRARVGLERLLHRARQAVPGPDHQTRGTGGLKL